MFDYLNWKREIADVMFALTQLVEHLANAHRTGGFDLTAALLERVGRNYNDDETAHERVVTVTMPLPKHGFEIAITKTPSVDCQVTVTGLPRYAGFLLFCTLPARRVLVDLHHDAPSGVSWRARKLFESIREDQRLAA